MPWSTQSQMKPPWSTPKLLITSQYKSRPPQVLPMAWEYSHMMRGLAVVEASLASPYLCNLAWLGYMGTKMSMFVSIVSAFSVSQTGSIRACSYCTGLVGSRLLSHMYVPWWFTPLPASFPRDQMITLGWFLSRSM